MHRGLPRAAFLFLVLLRACSPLPELLLLFAIPPIPPLLRSSPQMLPATSTPTMPSSAMPIVTSMNTTAATLPRAVAATIPSRTLLQIYRREINLHPIRTKALTTALIASIGDIVAQSLSPTAFSLRRLVGVLTDGLLIAGPFMAFSYDKLETTFPSQHKQGIAKSIAALKMMLVSCFIIDTFFVLEMTTVSYILEGLPLAHLLAHLRADFPTTLRAGTAATLALCPADFLVWRYLPPKARQMGMNMIDLVWTAVISYFAHRNRVCAI